MRQLIKFLILSIVFSMMATASYACTRALWVTKNGTYVGRNMDWGGTMRSDIWVYPRGMSQVGGMGKNPLRWVSKYGSIVDSASDTLTTDGVNEKGLGVHMLWLDESDYGPRNLALPGLSVTNWVQYYLDSFASVSEAIQETTAHPFQILPFKLPGNTPINIHLALDDMSGDSAVIEYLNGQIHIYHDAAFKVVTNSPSYDQQLLNLGQYLSFGGDKSLPGSNDSTDRFVRASFYDSQLPDATAEHDAVAYMLSVLNNVAGPYGVPSELRPTVSMTIWHSISNLSNQTYYFQTTSNMKLMWAKLSSFDLSEGAPMMKLDLSRDDLVGDVTKQFTPVPV